MSFIPVIQRWISVATTPVLSVGQETFLIIISVENSYFYFKYLCCCFGVDITKNVCDIYTYIYIYIWIFVDQSSKEQHLFKNFNITNILIVTFGQFNLSLVNESIYNFKP